MDVLGNWAFVALIVLATGALLLVALRRAAVDRRPAFVVLAAYALASVALGAFLIMPASASGATCSSATLDNTHAEALDGSTADELAAQGIGNRVADCRHNARLRYLAGMTIFCVAGVTAAAATTRRTSRRAAVAQRT